MAVRSELASLVARPWFIPTLVSAYLMLYGGQQMEALWLMGLAILTTQDEYFSLEEGGE